jgi:hypothetical protein
MLLSLSCYNLVCHYFLHLWSILYTHTCHISCILLLCSTAQKMKSSLMNTYSRRASPRSSSCGVVLVSTVLTSWSCNKLYIKTQCNKHWLYYLFHYLSFYVWNVILADIKVMHSVLVLKLVWQAGCWNDKISCWCHTVANIMWYLYIWISESRPRSRATYYYR